MNSFQRQVLTYFNLSATDYELLTAKVSFKDLPDPTFYLGFSEFMARINLALERDEKIVIYGDYDADGVMATSILKEAFARRGKDVFTMIPSRYKDGYGLNPKVVTKFKERGINLIITVDNGISAYTAINLANEYGIDVLVSDHHEIGETLPAAHAILHPHLNIDGDNLNSCGAFMALIISHGLLGGYDPYLLSLASVATIADMMPLKGVNRTLLKLALHYMNAELFPALLRLNGQSFFDSQSIAFKIAPKINALGRLSQNYEANVLIEYFTTEDALRRQAIYNYIMEVYEVRKNASRGEELSVEELNGSVIALISDELEGVLGLLAQNYLTKYNKPAFIFTPSSEDATLLKGSVRSREGFSVLDAFSYLKDLIIQAGGHQEAGGLTIKKEDFPLFKNKLNLYAKNYPLLPKVEVYLPITHQEVTKENYAFLAALAPFGFGFKSPIFEIVDAYLMVSEYSRDGKHILFTNKEGIKYVGFNLGEISRNSREYRFYGTFSESEFRAQRSVDFQITAIK